jgi:hypothetical protein
LFLQFTLRAVSIPLPRLVKGSRNKPSRNNTPNANASLAKNPPRDLETESDGSGVFGSANGLSLIVGSSSFVGTGISGMAPAIPHNHCLNPRHPRFKKIQVK